MPQFKSKVPDATRAEVLERIHAGESYAKVSAETGVKRSTISTWVRRFGEPRGIAPPDSAPAGKVKGTPGRKTVTEATAGTLLSGAFTSAGIIDRCDVWVLTTDERDSLAVPLSDSMRCLPAPWQEFIQKYAAPFTLGAALLAVIAHKLRVRAERKRAERERTRPGMFSPPAPAPSQAHGLSSNVAAAASANGFTVAAASSNGNAPHTAAELAQAAAAAAAAHGSLSELDVADDGDATRLLQ